MKANHNTWCIFSSLYLAVPNISKSKNESKSQHIFNFKSLSHAVPNISKSKNESKSQPANIIARDLQRCA